MLSIIVDMLMLASGKSFIGTRDSTFSLGTMHLRALWDFEETRGNVRFPLPVPYDTRRLTYTEGWKVREQCPAGDNFSADKATTLEESPH